MTDEDAHRSGSTIGHEYPGTPRWVKVFGIVVIGLVLLVIIALVVGTVLGIHKPGGPGGHGMRRGIAPQILFSSVIEDSTLSGEGHVEYEALFSVTEQEMS